MTKLQLPRPIYYRLTELAEEWEVPVEHLLRYAELGLLPVRAHLRGNHRFAIEVGEIVPGEATANGQYPQRSTAGRSYALLPRTIADIHDLGSVEVWEVKAPSEGLYCRFYTGRGALNVDRGGTLPVLTIADLVVTTPDLREFESRFSAEPHSAKEVANALAPLQARLENNYLRLIAALVRHMSGRDIHEPHKVAESVEMELASAGIECPVGAQTLANYLKKARELM